MKKNLKENPDILKMEKGGEGAFGKIARIRKKRFGQFQKKILRVTFTN